MKLCTLATALGMVLLAAARPGIVDSLECAVCESSALDGNIQDCCCDARTVDGANSQHFLPTLDALAKQPYFRFFKADLWKPCAFWPDDGQCMQEECAVCECEPDDMPQSYAEELQQARQGKLKAPAAPPGCGATSKAATSPYGPSGITPSRAEVGSDFKSWNVAEGPHEANVWTLQDEDSPTIAYVDLLVNQEGYTGYAGPNAARIWRAIYTENCFPITGGAEVQDMCPEQRVFFRLISGLQSSINTHIALTVDEGRPSLDMWLERVGRWPDRLENLYFVYLVLLRAADKARPILQTLPYDTGNPVADGETRQLVRQLLAAPQPDVLSAFDERGLFKVSREEVMATCPATLSDLSDLAALKRGYLAHAAAKQELRQRMRGAFRNVSRIMDCVGCDKCRLWGKIQFLGLGTALKLLFAEHDQVIVDSAAGIAAGEGGLAPPSDGEPPFDLSRNEVVALVNTLHRVSMSVQAAKDFRGQDLQRGLQRKGLPLLAGGAGAVLLGLILLCLWRGRRVAPANKEE